MVSYVASPVDAETGVERPGTVARPWKVCVALLAVGLGAAGALLLFCYWSQGAAVTVQQSTTEALADTRTDGVTDPRSTLRRIGNRARAAIHLEGYYDNTDSGHFNGQVEWREDRGQAFAQGGFLLMENQIVIPQTGLYFVYTQVSFRVSCNHGDSSAAAGPRPPASLSHRVWRESDSIGSEASLLSAVRSACQRDGIVGDGSLYRAGRGWYNTIYLGAVFQLQRGDKLRTETHPLAALDSDEGKTFFGVFAL